MAHVAFNFAVMETILQIFITRNVARYVHRKESGCWVKSEEEMDEG